MGRKAGVTTEETKAELLRAAARVFARKGYDGASIADISAESGLSSGPIYTHYGSKAELFAAMLREYAAMEVDKVMGRGDVLAKALARVGAKRGALLVEAIVAAKRDRVVAEVLAETFAARSERFADVFAKGQAEGTVVSDVTPDALARFALMLGLGAVMVGVLGLDKIDDDDWAALMARVVDAFTP